MDTNKYRNSSFSDIYTNLQVWYLWLLTSHPGPLHFPLQHLWSFLSPSISSVPVPLNFQNTFHINKVTKFLGWLRYIFLFPVTPEPSASRNNLPGISWQRAAQGEQQLPHRHSQHWQVVPRRTPDIQSTGPPSTRSSVTWCMCSETNGSRLCQLSVNTLASNHVWEWTRRIAAS